ncbi:ATP-grasp domain-containing protein [Hydrogenophilus thiooxidans]|uniref:ATP-grasp domain-containing protein n=1 Tax=Hydrogenophilus thiooxidans TaxID=2820326 RepID=UPI001C21FFED|nr:ATP-grasp domain-containing protein [Hydrogenophilus thiooxidans]
MKKTLLLGSSYSAIPLFFLLKKKGFKVHVCGNKKNDPCHKFADKSYYADYSNYQNIIKIIENEQFDYIIPTCNDYSYLTGSILSEKYNFPGFDTFETTKKLHHKNEFRTIAKTLKLPIPEFQIINIEDIDQIEININAPYLIKPINLFSGIGIQFVNNDQEIKTIIKKISKKYNTKILIAEKFIEGKLHSHSAFLENKAIALDFFVDEFCTTYPYQVNSSYYPSTLSKTAKKIVRENINLLAKSLNLTDGLIHTQFISNGNYITFIEIMRRCPGDLFGLLLEKATGFNYYESFLKPFINENFQFFRNRKTKHVGRYTITANKKLSIYGVSFKNIPFSKVDFFPLKKSGEFLNPAPHDKFGIVFIEFDSSKQMRELMPIIKKRISVIEERTKSV